MAKRSCENCKFRAWNSWSGIDYCMDYEMATTDEEMEASAKDCPRYECGTPDCFDADEYRPSCTARDYGPSNPWNAPGMSVHDFI